MHYIRNTFASVRHHPHFVLIILALTAGFSSLVLIVSFYFSPIKTRATDNQDSKFIASEKLWRSEESFLRENKTKRQKIIEATISYDTAKTPVISFEKIRIKNGFVPDQELLGDKEPYTLELTDNEDAVIYFVEFLIPDTVMPLPEPIKNNLSLTDESKIKLKKTRFVLTVPWDKSAIAISIVNPSGTVIQTIQVKDAEIINNKSNFNSIKGNELKFFKKSSLLHNLVSDVYAETDHTNSLDITFIGNNYTAPADLTTFQADVDRFALNLLNYEPFNNRKNQIYFHYVNNTADLGCTYNGRVIACDTALVTQTINSSGAPYDKIYVIVNNPVYGGGALGNISAGYNGSWGSQIFIHEFGHSLAQLADEYLANHSTSRSDRNCYNGTPPNPAWEGIVQPNSYYLECNFPSFYRSSENSIMRSMNSYFFNPLSQKYINDAIDYYAGPTISPTENPTPTPPIDGCLLHKNGDANCDEIIGIEDFNCWNTQYVSKSISPGCFTANFDNKDGLDVYDFEIWRNNYVNRLLNNS